MMIVSFVNQKGGVGKTSTTVNTASALAVAGQRVLVIDLDPQANATTALGIASEDITIDIADILRSDTQGIIADQNPVIAARPPEWTNVHCLPATLDLAKPTDAELGAEFRLKKALNSPNLEDLYDIVLIDSPPSVGTLTVNALIASTHTLIVTEPSAPAITGVQNLFESINAVREYYSPDLQVAGVLVNRMTKTREAATRYTELATALADTPVQVWEEQTIPNRTAISESLGAQVPIHSLKSRAGEIPAIYDSIAQRLLALDTINLPTSKANA